MARIYFNVPQCLEHIHWIKTPQNWNARQITAVVIFFFVVILVVFAVFEAFVLTYPAIGSTRHEHSHSDLGAKGKANEFGPNVHYGIVIDCGSSGSRIFVYFWPPHSGNPEDLLDIQQLMDKNGKPVVKKITPGLDTFKDNPRAASDYIKPLLKYAASYIPPERHKETLLFILATAGMRMIPEKSQKLIFENLNTEIPKMYQFVVAESNLEVISGKQEGVYAWIAVNYVLQKFGHGADEHPLVAVEIPGSVGKEKKTHIRRRTVGMLDMGGGSMQIAFEITSSKYQDIPKHRIAEFNLGCQNNDLEHTYRVYVTTFLGFGANEARERYEEMLLSTTAHANISKSTNDTIIPYKRHKKRIMSDPCLPVGLMQESDDRSGHTHSFRGTGDYEACQNSLFPLLNTTRKCEKAPCSMNGIHQPTISFHNSEFYGFSEFWYTMDDVYRIGGVYQSDKFDHEAKKFCSTEWPKLRGWYEENLFPRADENRFKFQCFKSAWMSAVLHKGLKFPRSYKMLHSVHLINRKEVQWTLGALLHRTRYLPLRTIKSSSSFKQLRPHHHKKSSRIFNNEYVIIFCFVIVFIAIFLYMKRLKLCPTKQADLGRVPSMSYFMVENDQIEQGVKIQDYP